MKEGSDDDKRMMTSSIVFILCVCVLVSSILDICYL